MAAADGLAWAREHVRGIRAQGEQERLVAIAVASLDFVAAVRGRTRGLTSAADQALMFAWREVADVLLVGARTLAVERYGSMLPEQLQAERTARGRPPLPPVATISRRGDLDLDRIRRANTPPELLVYGAQPPPPTDAVEWRRSPPDVAVADVVRDLRRRGAQVIVCEGGPQLFALAFAAGLVTDYSLTLAPAVVGHGEPVIGPELKSAARDLRLAAATSVEHHVFIHYAL